MLLSVHVCMSIIIRVYCLHVCVCRHYSSTEWVLASMPCKRNVSIFLQSSQPEPHSDVPSLPTPCFISKLYPLTLRTGWNMLGSVSHFLAGVVFPNNWKPPDQDQSNPRTRSKIYLVYTDQSLHYPTWLDTAKWEEKMLACGGWEEDVHRIRAGLHVQLTTGSSSCSAANAELKSQQMLTTVWQQRGFGAMEVQLCGNGWG